MKTLNPRSIKKIRNRTKLSGFALIVTLSLMILLTVIAVGLLTLSSISLRASSQGEAMQAARASARMALMLAIGDLQKQLGPDTRISASADQLTGTDPTDPALTIPPQAQRQWSGAYQSWPAALPSDARPAPQFLQWFVSGSPASILQQDYAKTSLPAGPKDSIEIVTAKSVGNTGDPVRVPLISQTTSNGTKNNLAWWVSDLGTKALISESDELPTGIAKTRMNQQAAPAFNIRTATAGTSTPFKTLSLTDTRLSKIVSWQSSALLADTPQNIQGLFHDLTPRSSGLLTNVRSGGFRKDLSMELERTSSKAPTTPLYTVGGETGINLQELWAYYNLCSSTNNPRGLKRSGSAKFTTGGTMSSGTPFFQVESSPTACRSDDGFYFKQPVIISYQIVFSFQTRTVTDAATNKPVIRLHLVADPIITLWNPLDVPVVVPTNSFFSIKWWQIPYDLLIGLKGGTLNKYPIIASLSAAHEKTATEAATNGDGNFLSLQVGKAQQLVFKPGEVIKLSQTGSSIVKGTSPVDHALVGKAGFNYGGGVSVPVRDIAGKYVDLKATDVINYQAKANDLTAGATSSDGNSLNGKGVNHSRHFSITHNEYYIGADRADLGDSLGIGNMVIDWDFGNQRLKVGENRGLANPGITGTKRSNERLTADKFPDIFKSITASDARDLPVSALSVSKQPFMMLSFNAKTENSSDLGTRCLSRFNPKALHVDFYDFSQKERDMLPYEFLVEPLSGWKNRSLEVSSNGNSYFGGGLNAADGTSFLTTHSVPREPLVSLAALQYSFANGFDIQKPKYGYAALNAREPMLPQISHAIGNSMACPVLESDKTEGTLAGGRPLADHSYLANQALWDDWFFSGIAPQNVNTFSPLRTQKQVASEFFSGTSKLPEYRYEPDLRSRDAADVMQAYLPSATPSAVASAEIASLIRVNGMFNINSTSVEAWKCLLGGLKDHPVVIRDDSGKESVKAGTTDTPVSGLMAPLDSIAEGKDNVDVTDPAQWVGRRTLTDPEIDALARGIVKEVRKRGPFLCLADFINRRVGSDKKLARSGAIQSALDSPDTGINEAYVSGIRAVGGAASSRFAFPEAEEGPLAYGAPGIVKQADILTPIAPVLSARSDSFLVRSYGEKVDASGKVIARAWCEAVVQRSAEFIDPSDAAEKDYASIGKLNKTFGRRFDIVSFRWLDASEA